MEADIERQERITAPLQLVWEELDSLEQVLAKSPQTHDYDMGPGGQQARVKVRLAWGPVKWTIEVDATLADLRPTQHVDYTLEVPSLDLRYEAAIDLDLIGNAESRLDYRGHLEVRHRLAARMGGMFNETIEEYVHGFVHRVKIKAEQRRLADERLLQ